ncbi:MAG: recombination protein NinG [Pseudomonadota bacterium]
MVLKTRKCKHCKTVFQKTSPLHSLCSPKCAIANAESLKLKREAVAARKSRIDTKTKLDKIKSLTDWLKDAERYCNKYVRLRDENLPCISCGTTKNVQYAAGHYRTVKAAPHLRFNLDNIQKQCNSYCNRHLSGNISEYRPNLIKKIGIERVEALENNNDIHRYTIEEAKEILAKFRKLCREFKSTIG